MLRVSKHIVSQIPEVGNVQAIYIGRGSAIVNKVAQIMTDEATNVDKKLAICQSLYHLRVYRQL